MQHLCNRDNTTLSSTAPHSLLPRRNPLGWRWTACGGRGAAALFCTQPHSPQQPGLKVQKQNNTSCITPGEGTTAVPSSPPVQGIYIMDVSKEG